MSTTETKAAPKKRVTKAAPKKPAVKVEQPTSRSFRVGIRNTVFHILGITAHIDERVAEALKAKKAKVPKPAAMRGQRPPKAPPKVTQKTEPTGDEQL